MKRSHAKPAKPARTKFRRFLTPLILEAAAAVVVLALLRRRQTAKPA